MFVNIKFPHIHEYMSVNVLPQTR